MKPKPAYLLIDFNASRRYSHHWTYLLKYKNFLNDINVRSEIWVPKNADLEIVNDLGSNCKPILRSNVYGFQKNQKYFSWLYDKIIEKLFMILKFLKFKFFLELIKFLISSFYTYKPYFKIKSICSSGKELVIIFPTLDSVGFRLVEKCLVNNLKIKRVCLRLGTGYKDIFKVEDLEKRLANLIISYSDLEISVGYETFPHKEVLEEFGIPSSNLFWAPAPPTRNKIKKSNYNKVFTLGFLGVARPNKGFTDIPLHIRILISKNIKFQALVQEAVYPWKEYISAKTELESLNLFVKIIPANITHEMFESLFSTIDVLVLPYNLSNYSIAGSGLLFTAADFGIPTFSKKGVAFQWDIESYSIGMCYSQIEDFALKIGAMLDTQSKVKFDFERYNLDRHIAINQFLGLNIYKSNANI